MGMQVCWKFSKPRMMCPKLDRSIHALVNRYDLKTGALNEPVLEAYPRPSELLPHPIEWDALKIEEI